MDTLQSELNELKNFIADLKIDQAAQKDKDPCPSRFENFRSPCNGGFA